ncbi:MAG: hypothetical protein ABSH37_13970 [Bryobacteraceae bacterium]
MPLAEHMTVAVDESRIRGGDRRNAFGNVTRIEKIVGIEWKNEPAPGSAHSRIARGRQPEVRLLDETVDPRGRRADVPQTLRLVGSIVNQDDLGLGIGLCPRRCDGFEKPFARVVARDDDGNQVHGRSLKMF